MRAGERGDGDVTTVRAVLEAEPAVQSEHMRLARRILTRALHRTAPPADAVVIAADGRWFRYRQRQVSLEGHPTHGRIARLLGTAPGSSDLDAVFQAGWPGEVATPSARKNRVRVAVSALRKQGLPVAFDRGASGYVLRVTVVID